VRSRDMMTLHLDVRCSTRLSLSGVRKLPKEALEFFRREGAKGGKASAEARMRKLTPEKRSAIAKAAAKARWEKVKKATPEEP
jgi:hypothetical protein